MHRAASALSLSLALAACASDEPIVTGGFRETVIDDRVRHGQGVRVMDLDGDGAVEVIAALSLTDAVHIYRRGADPAEPWPATSISGSGTIVAMDPEVADFDGDGDLDVAAAGLFMRDEPGASPGRLVWYENPGEISGGWVAHPIDAEPIYGPRSLAAADFDGDGDIDLAFGATQVTIDGAGRGNGVYWCENEGGAFASPSLIDAGAADVGRLIARDLDGDGRPDLVASARASLELLIYRNLPGPSFERRVVATGGAFGGIVIANLDADPAPELAAAVTYTSSATVHIIELPGDLTGPFLRRDVVTDLVAAEGETPATGLGLAAADFDGDGVGDLALSTSSGGDLRVYLGGDGTFTPRVIRSGYLGLTGLATADVDADGRVDLVTTTYELGTRDRVAWWQNVAP